LMTAIDRFRAPAPGGAGGSAAGTAAAAFIAEEGDSLVGATA
jgi:hypothetical protein